MEMINLKTKKISVIGLGYVGLPLAVEFGKKYSVVGFDINEQRVEELKNGKDHTLEISERELQDVLIDNRVSTSGLFVTTDLTEMSESNVYIVTVPTPTDKNNRPVLTPLKMASKTIGKVLKKGDIVIYESTVYPGATEEECVPVLVEISKLKFNVDFFVGYSPERINPGDKKHTITNILKVTSGSTVESANIVDALYKSIVTAGTYKAASIKVAEAAKVIENSQRDLNIAFVNELSKIFNKMGLDTLDVLKAAETKWNFLPFRPGLVGGHCIGVDPYYLAQKAQELGYHPEIILSGRRLNDSMGNYVAAETTKLMIKKGIKIKGASVLMLGITFKENCPDIRNTRAIDVYRELESFGMIVHLYDPWASYDEVLDEYGIEILTSQPNAQYDAILLTVSHDSFRDLDLNELKKDVAVTYDVKSILPKETVDGRL